MLRASETSSHSQRANAAASEQQFGRLCHLQPHERNGYSRQRSSAHSQEGEFGRTCEAIKSCPLTLIFWALVQPACYKFCKAATTAIHHSRPPDPVCVWSTPYVWGLVRYFWICSPFLLAQPSTPRQTLGRRVWSTRRAAGYSVRISNTRPCIMSPPRLQLID